MNLGSASVFLVAVSFVSPTATVKHIDAQANVVYMQPAAKTSYMEVKVQAEVTFPDVYAVDVITPTDLVTLAISKGNQETLTASETFLNVFTKQLDESSVLADSFSSINSYIRSYTDTATSSDSAALLNQLAKSESLTTSDSSTLDTNKGLSDGFTLTDNMDGVLQYDIVKTTTETLVSSDSYAVAFSKAVADNTSLVSSGLIIMQDYSDITYFLEDYVGVSTSFT